VHEFGPGTKQTAGASIEFPLSVPPRAREFPEGETIHLAIEVSEVRTLPRSASTVLLGELHAERLEVPLVRGDLFAFEGNRDPWFAALETFCDDPLCQQELQELESELWAAILAAAREGIGKFFKLRGEVHRAFPPC